MTPYEMEEQLKNIDVRTKAIERILPTLATKDDLRLTTEALRHEMARFATKEDLRGAVATLATKEELRAAIASLATKEDVTDARRYALMLNEATRDDIRLLAEHMVTMRAQLDRIEQRLP